MNALKPQEVMPEVANYREEMELIRDFAANKMPQLPFPERTSVCIGGMHAISATMKCGSLVVGRVHLTEHLNIMSSGDITVVTEDGRKRYTGFNVIACKPGSRRIGLVHADTTWTTIFKTDETDMDTVLESLTSAIHPALESKP